MIGGSTGCLSDPGRPALICDAERCEYAAVVISISSSLEIRDERDDSTSGLVFARFTGDAYARAPSSRSAVAPGGAGDAGDGCLVGEPPVKTVMRSFSASGRPRSPTPAPLQPSAPRPPELPSRSPASEMFDRPESDLRVISLESGEFGGRASMWAAGADTDRL